MHTHIQFCMLLYYLNFIRLLCCYLVSIVCANVILIKVSIPRSISIVDEVMFLHAQYYSCIGDWKKSSLIPTLNENLADIHQGGLSPWWRTKYSVEMSARFSKLKLIFENSISIYVGHFVVETLEFGTVWLQGLTQIISQYFLQLSVVSVWRLFVQFC